MEIRTGLSQGFPFAVIFLNIFSNQNFKIASFFKPYGKKIDILELIFVFRGLQAHADTPSVVFNGLSIQDRSVYF